MICQLWKNLWFLWLTPMIWVKKKIQSCSCYSAKIKPWIWQWLPKKELEKSMQSGLQSRHASWEKDLRFLLTRRCSTELLRCPKKLNLSQSAQGKFTNSMSSSNLSKSKMLISAPCARNAPSTHNKLVFLKLASKLEKTLRLLFSQSKVLGPFLLKKLFWELFAFCRTNCWAFLMLSNQATLGSTEQKFIQFLRL